MRERELLSGSGLVTSVLGNCPLVLEEGKGARWFKTEKKNTGMEKKG